MASKKNISFALDKHSTKEEFYDYLANKIYRKFKPFHLESIRTAVLIAEPTPGFTAVNSVFSGTDVILKTCSLCDQLAISAFKCETCDNLYCEGCALTMVVATKMKNNQPTKGTTLESLNLQRIDCINDNCSKNTIISKTSSEAEYELETFMVNCIYKDCDYKNFYKRTSQHVNECKFKSEYFKFDQAYIADIFINQLDEQLEIDGTMVNYLKNLENENNNDTRNAIASDVYTQTFRDSLKRQGTNLLSLKEKIASMEKEIETQKALKRSLEPQPSTSKAYTVSKPTTIIEQVPDSPPRKKSRTPSPPFNWDSIWTSKEQKEEYSRQQRIKEQKRAEERERKQKEYQEIKAKSKESLELRKRVRQPEKPKESRSDHYSKESQKSKETPPQSHQSKTSHQPRRELFSKSRESFKSNESLKSSEPVQKKIKSFVVNPTFKPDIPPEIDEHLLSTDGEQYKPDSTPGPAQKQDSDYADLLKRKWHAYSRRHAVTRNQKLKDRRNKNYEEAKAAFCEKQIEKINPPRHFAWLIAKNNIRLHEDGLNACAIDIENLSLRVKTVGNQTEVIQVPCWVSIVDSSGEIVYNEFIRHPKSAIEDFLTEHHGLTWNEIKNAPVFLKVRQEVITILRKYKRIIVSGQVQDFKALMINPIDHNYLLQRIICVSSYYNARLNNTQLGLRYCLFALFGRITQNREHSSILDAAGTMYLYLVDYERIEKTHSDIIKTSQIKIHLQYYGYIYPKNYLMSGLIKDIMGYIGDWPLAIKKTSAMYMYMSKEKRERKLANLTYDPSDFVHAEPEPRPIPYKFSETKFSYLNRPRT